MGNRLWLTVPIVLVLGLGSHVMALGDNRLDEMIEEIEERVESSDEQEVFIEAVEDYIEERDEALTDLVALLALSEAEQEEDWLAIVTNLGSIPELADIDDYLESEAALELYEEFMTEEEEWVSELIVLETAAYRDLVVALRERLVTMTTLLDDKWEGYLNDDGGLDERQNRVMADIYTILAKVASDSDASREKVRNSLQIVTDILSQVDVVSGLVPGAVGDAINQALGVIAEVVKTFNAYRTAEEALRPQVRDLATQEIGVLILFSETCEDTQLFVEENGYDVMKGLYDDAVDELDDFEGVGTDGQQDDAEEFVDLVKRALDVQLREGETIFNAFVAKHKFKFFGPVGPDIRELLAETSVWRADQERVDDLDLEEVLSDWRSGANSFFNVSLSRDGITDYEREFFEEALRNDMEALQEAIDDAGTAFSTENLLLLRDRRDVGEAIDNCGDG